MTDEAHLYKSGPLIGRLHLEQLPPPGFISVSCRPSVLTSLSAGFHFTIKHLCFNINMWSLLDRYAAIISRLRRREPTSAGAITARQICSQRLL